MISTYKKTILYGFNREPKVRRFLYSCLLSLSYFLVVGIPLLLGYMVKIVRKRGTGENKDVPPRFRPLSQLYVDGFYSIFFALVSTGLPTILLGICLQVLEVSITEDTEIDVIVIGVINGLLASLLLMVILGSYLFIAMILLYAKNDDWMSSLNISLLTSQTLNRSYLKLYIKFITISLVFGYLCLSLLSSWFLAPLGFITWFIYIVVSAIIIGDFYRDNIHE